MTAYYNEFDPKAVAWLRELIADGLIAHGEVDERSIVDVAASDLKGYCQYHFFAGIGGWSYALRLAGWPDDLPVWTASLPCQPFSAAGKGLGKQDERHLLPHFISLVAQCRPTVLFGEQVSAAIKHGWLDDLYTEMEANNYAVGSIVIGAHSVGAAHIRQRLYWVADNGGERCEEQPGERRILSKAYGNEQGIEAAETTRHGDTIIATGGVNGLHDSESERRAVCDPKDVRSNDGEVDALADPSCGVNEQSSVMQTAGVNRMGDSESNDQQRDRQREACDGSQESVGGSSVLIGMANAFDIECFKPGNRRGNESVAGAAGRANSHSSELESIDWIYCRDNKYRPVKSGIKPLVDGVPRGMVHNCNPFNTQEARTVRLKGYGNAIVPTLAAEFIKAYMQCKK